MLGWELLLINVECGFEVLFGAVEVAPIDAHVRQTHQIVADEHVSGAAGNTIVIEDLTQYPLGAIEVAGAAQVAAVIGHRIQCVRMGRAQDALEHAGRLEIQRRGLRELVLHLQCHCDVVHVHGDLGMILSQRLAVDVERGAVERFGFGKVAPIGKESGQVVHDGGGLGRALLSVPPIQIQAFVVVALGDFERSALLGELRVGVQGRRDLDRGRTLELLLHFQRCAQLLFAPLQFALLAESIP